MLFFVPRSLWQFCSFPFVSVCVASQLGIRVGRYGVSGRRGLVSGTAEDFLSFSFQAKSFFFFFLFIIIIIRLWEWLGRE